MACMYCWCQIFLSNLHGQLNSLTHWSCQTSDELLTDDDINFCLTFNC